MAPSRSGTAGVVAVAIPCRWGPRRVWSAATRLCRSSGRRPSLSESFRDLAAVCQICANVVPFRAALDDEKPCRVRAVFVHDRSTLLKSRCRVKPDALSVARPASRCACALNCEALRRLVAATVRVLVLAANRGVG